jgi:hypothetical protein
MSNKQQRQLPDDDVVDSFAAWCAANHISEATGRRLIASGGGPAIVRLSARRIGICRKDNRTWLEARTEGPQAA